MKYCYRGIGYESTSALVETIEGEIAGKYRGLVWRFRHQKNAGTTSQCDRCLFFAHSPYIVCAVNPNGPDTDRCKDFESDDL